MEGGDGVVWVRVDDQHPDHPKVIAAGPMAAWLNVCGWCYAARYLTDGFIPAGQVRRLADVPDADVLARRLVEVGLWEDAAGGFVIHDYLEYNPSRAKVTAERAAAAERSARSRKRANRGVGSSQGGDSGADDVGVITSDAARSARSGAARERNVTWDGLAEIVGGPATKSERSDFAKTVRELEAARVTIDEIVGFARWWGRVFEGAPLTHRCYRSHLGKYRTYPDQVTDMTRGGGRTRESGEERLAREYRETMEAIGGGR
jgi:hypothetical protein